MDLLRKLLAVPLQLLLFVFLLTAPIAIGATQVLTDPEPIKGILSQEGIYDSVLELAMQQPITENLGQTGSLTEEELFEGIMQEVIDDLELPTYMEQESNKVIDETYKWLETPGYQLNIHIDVDSKLREATELLNGSVADKFNAIPNCASGEFPEIPSETASIFSINCLPAEFDRSIYLDELTREPLLAEESMDVNMTEEDLGLAPEATLAVKSAYALAQNYQNVLITIVVVLIVLILLLIPNRIAATFSLAYVFLGSSILAIVGNVLYKASLAAQPFIAGDPTLDGLDIMVTDIMAAISVGILEIASTTALILLGIGGVLLTAAILLRKGQEDEDTPAKTKDEAKPKEKKKEGAKAPPVKPAKSA